MPKPKLADRREIPRIPLKQISVERAGSPFLTNLERQHVREGELPLSKSKFLEDSDIASISITMTTGSGLNFNSTLTIQERAVKNIPIKGWSQINIYVAQDNDPDYLWPTGTALTTEQKKLQISQIHNIVGFETPKNDIDINQQRVACRLVNTSADTQTYYVYVHWIFVRV